MGRKYSIVLKKGAWTEEEDTLLKRCIEKHGEGNWHKAPLRAGLNRCRKSCRLRWFNYLHPSIKREEFSWDEIDLIIKMHKLLGNRWSLIAARLPGRTANDVKNRWNTYIYKSLQKKQQQTEETTTTPKTKPIKPQPRNFSRIKIGNNSIENAKQCSEKSPLEFEKEHSMKWWENLLLDEEADGKAENNSSSSGSKDELSFDSFPFDGIIVPNINDMSMCLDLNLWES